jgi:GH24 family phage-related lysozyme (muramidase)
MSSNTLSTSERVKHIQTYLDLEPDGMIGPATLTAIEDRLFDVNDKSQEDYSLLISRAGMEQLVRHEVVSKPYYNRFLKKPIWPGGSSGVTIGIGYDLGYNRSSQIQRDWSGKVTDVDLEKLKKVSGLKADKAKKQLSRLKAVKVSFESANSVFSESTLPRYAAATRKAYPGIEKLHADAQTALLSLVYNRGSSFSGSRRKEMAAIKPLVLQKDYAAIAEQIQNMKRLWQGKGLAGLLKRRDDEAELVLKSNRNYALSELIRV